jgi:hypothetical protein
LFKNLILKVIYKIDLKSCFYFSKAHLALRCYLPVCSRSSIIQEKTAWNDLNKEKERKKERKIESNK